MNIPKLRFKEFSGEWEEKKLYEIAKKITDKNIENKINIVLTNSAEHGIIKQEDFFDKEIANEKNINTYYLVEKDSFVYNPRISKFAPFGPINRNHLECGVVSPLYLVFNINEEYRNFMEKYFKTSYWYKYMYNVGNSGVRSDRMNISNNDFFNMNVFIPNILQEQQKIADFLSTVDRKISIVDEKLNLFKEYKKGIMQKIFSQKIRFKDSEGNDYPEWEEKRLKDIVQSISNGISINQNFDKTGYKVTRIETISEAKINLEKIGYITTDKDIEEYKLNIGDLLFSNINSVEHIGKIAYVDKNYNLYHGMNLLRIVFKENLNSKYFYYLLTERKYKKLFEKLCNKAVSQASINQTELSKIKVYIPCLEEQEKIADFLSSIDNKIDNLASELENLKEFKKGLLQQMFV